MEGGRSVSTRNWLEEEERRRDMPEVEEAGVVIEAVVAAAVVGWPLLLELPPCLCFLLRRREDDDLRLAAAASSDDDALERTLVVAELFSVLICSPPLRNEISRNKSSKARTSSLYCDILDVDVSSESIVVGPAEGVVVAKPLALPLGVVIVPAEKAETVPPALKPDRNERVSTDASSAS